jgi:hypothetical protein
MTEPTIIKPKARRARPKVVDMPAGEETAESSHAADTLTLKIKSRKRDGAQDAGRMIAEAAYYRAEKRGFAPGFEIEDWIAAENEVRAQQERA